MELQKLQRVVVDALEDIKAQDIKVFNTVGQSDMFDRVVVATGNSNRQTRALAWHVVQKVKEAGGAVTSVEGADPGEWVLVDLGDIVVHLMQPNIRQYYALEEMWGTKPVRIKLAAERRPSLAPSAEEAPAVTAMAKKAVVKKAPAKSGSKSPAKAGSESSAKRGGAKKAVGAAPARKSAAKGAARKPTKQTGRTSSTAKKTAPKKTARSAARPARSAARPPAKGTKSGSTAARKRRSASR
jgi:ribosome-associated protein